VRVGGLTVSPGDLLHGDKHGVTVIPPSIAAEVVSAAARMERQERQIIDLCQAPDFTLEELKERWKKVRGVY
jgi:4-hydroxy-4-methyl-2-oxoglutarate aldolase